MEDKILFVMGNGPSLGEVMNDPKDYRYYVIIIHLD